MEKMYIMYILFLQVYEPSELEKIHLTDRDNEIRISDMPERFQVVDVGYKKLICQYHKQLCVFTLERTVHI